MRDVVFTLEEADLRRAVAAEYEPLGMHLVDIRFDSRGVVGVFTPAGADAPRFEAQLDESTLGRVVSRHALRVMLMRVTSVKRIGDAELRVEAQLADERCETCGQHLGQPAMHAPVTTVPALTATMQEVITTPRIEPMPVPMRDLPGAAGRILPVPSGRPIGFGDHEVVTIPTMTLVPIPNTDGSPTERFELAVPDQTEASRA